MFVHVENTVEVHYFVNSCLEESYYAAMKKILYASLKMFLQRMNGSLCILLRGCEQVAVADALLLSAQTLAPTEEENRKGNKRTPKKKNDTDKIEKKEHRKAVKGLRETLFTQYRCQSQCPETELHVPTRTALGKSMALGSLCVDGQI